MNIHVLCFGSLIFIIYNFHKIILTIEFSTKFTNCSERSPHQFVHVTSIGSQLLLLAAAHKGKEQKKGIRRCETVIASQLHWLNGVRVKTEGNQTQWYNLNVKNFSVRLYRTTSERHRSVHFSRFVVTVSDNSISEQKKK